MCDGMEYKLSSVGWELWATGGGIGFTGKIL